MDFPLKIDSAPVFTQVLTPTNVAILASLGVHAFVLGLALPYLQGSDTQEKVKGQVGVVELTDAEQSRLPDASPFSGNSSAMLPDPNNFPPATNAPGLPSNNQDLNLPTSNPPLPNEDYKYNSLTGAVPSTSSLPPLPSISQTTPSYPNLPGGYSGIPSYPSNYGSLSRFPVTAPPFPSSLSSGYIPRRSSLPSNPINTGDSGNLPSPSRPKFDNSAPMKGTDFIAKAPQTANLPGSENNAANVPAAEPGLVAQGQDTPSEEALRNDLYARAKYGNLTSSEIEVVNLVGSYPRIACRNRTEASVVYYVDPSGSVSRVSESRYPIFNTLAQQAFQSQRFLKPTRVTVNFKYDPQVCASVATTNPNAPVMNTATPDSPGIIPPRSLAPTPMVTPLNSATQTAPPPLVTTPSLPPQNKTTGDRPGVNSTPSVQPPSNARVNPPNSVPSPSEISPKNPETSVKPGLPPIPKAPTSNIPLPSSSPAVSPASPPVPNTTVKNNPLPREMPSVSPVKPDAIAPSPGIGPKPKPEVLSTPNAGTNLLDNLRSRWLNTNPQTQATPAVKAPEVKPKATPENGETNPVAPNLDKK